jgi:uncharacterized protein (DUF2141 family)
MIKKTLILIGIILASRILYSEPKDLSKITIQVDGVKNNIGSINVAIYRSDADFEQEKFAYVHRLPAIPNAKFIFENVPMGKYAVAVYHDENENMKLDRNLIGLPKEGYGFSNNAKGTMGPPKFSNSSFTIQDSETKIKIQLNY